MTGFAELGALTNFSFLEGASHPHEIVGTAKALGHAAVGVTDRNSFAGVVRAHVAAKEQGLRFVPGVRLCLADGFDYLAWPTDRAAWGRLTRLLSAGRMAAPKGECRIDRDALVTHAEGCVMALAVPDDIGTDFAARLRADAAALRPHLALPLFCAVAHRFRGDDRRRLDALARLGPPLLAAGGTRYHAPERRRLADVLTAIRLRTTIDALGFAAEANAEAHMKPPAEMLRLFQGHEDAIANTQRVVQACRFSLDSLRYEYPKEVLDTGRTAQETLEARVERALAERWPQGPSAKLRRLLDEELALIAQLDYAPYFLTVHEIVRFAESKGILFQGRGSAANSAVCYVLGITAADVETHDLLFARFLSTARNEPPDIDVDFEHERREEVIQHIYERYGRDRAALCATLARYRPRSAIREVGKALGLTEDITAGLAKSVWGPRGDRDMTEIAAEKGLDAAGDPRLAMALELADEIQDFPRHLSTHVGGFVITEGPLVELAVVANAAMENRTTLEWDKDDIEALRMLKVDVLGLGMLTCLRRGFGLIEQHHGTRIGLRDMTLDDPRIYDMLCKADAIGVFQVESRAQMNMLPRLKPRKFYDLVVEVAIVRPGPIQGDMVHPYLRRRDGIEKADIPSPANGDPAELKAVLQHTFGVPLFQEQAMRIAIVAAGFTPTEADALRRSMATFRNEGKVAAFQQKFITGMLRRGYPRDFAERCFQQIEGFGSYGFPESHAMSFALLVYASAWVKCHHPAVFACALLNSQPMGFYAPAQIVRDAKAHGVAVRAVDVTASNWDCTLEADPRSAEGLALRLGLRLVTGLGEAEAKRIMEARAEAPFASIADLTQRARLDRQALESLAQADAFHGLGRDRRAALWDAAALSGPSPPLAAHDGAEAAPRLPRATAGEQTVLDYAATGLTLRAHPLALLRPQLDAMGLANTRALATARRGQGLRLPGLVLVRQRPGSAKGVVFFTVEDEHGIANLIMYPDIAERFRATVVAARLIVAEGTVERHDASAVPVIHLLVTRASDHSHLLGDLHRIDAARWEGAMARADEVRHPDYRGQARPRLRLPPSRDFH
ncbi:error-prone DNA polymerase [Neoroseomonas soli]|uniref:Error-prone DNA polymerase n=1 Tax=Neoroseomonas soli TaxID=1081025 RepID=A0A9X9WXV8_9PROT|nr:error-prone DNA polymerase [Neoroseomonas soli]MBR0671987.1 DNA polymerase III subunit alpha [Neoroseomonas soli]